MLHPNPQEHQIFPLTEDKPILIKKEVIKHMAMFSALSGLRFVDIKNLKWEKLKIETPYYFFVPKNFEVKESYDKGFSVSDLFLVF